MKIRNAIAKDESRLQVLVKQMGYEQSIEEVQDKISVYNARDRHALWVAEEKGMVVGFIALACYECFVEVGGTMTVTTLVVDQVHRWKGIGKKLMAAAEAYGLEQGCMVVELISFNKRRKDGTRAFYESLGYEDQVKTDLSYFMKEIR